MTRASVVLIMALVACGGDEPEASPRVAAGGQRVQERLCTTCHGSALSGATTAYPGTQAYPPNLTPDSTGLEAWTEQEIATAILEGTDREGAPLCNVMPNYRDMGMTDEQALEVAAYLRSLKPIARAIPDTTSCSAH